MRLSPFALALVTAFALAAAGCAPAEESPAVTGDDAALTQSRVPKLTNPAMEKLRSAYDAATAASDKESFFGRAAAFKWGSSASIESGLSAEQKTFLATKLFNAIEDMPDRLPSGADIRAADVTKANGAASELRLEGPQGAAVEAELGAVLGAHHLVVRLEPAKIAPRAVRTAGAMMVVDLVAREALILYGRRGPAPFHADCTVSKMISYEFEEALSKEEYPNVEAAVVPLLGDVLLDVGVNSTLSNANAIEDGEDYQVVVTKTGTAFEVEAKGAFFHAKLVVDGKTGVVYGDRDGNGRANKAAELTCETRQ